MWSLELIATFDRPPTIENHQWRFYGLPERGTLGILRDASTLQTFSAAGEGLTPLDAYSLPPGEQCEVAFHPAGRQLAITSADGIHLLTPESDRVAVERERLGGEPRAVLFDRAGELLWATVEAADGSSQACAVELASLEIVSRVELAGVAKAYHSLELHPSQPAIAVEVSCGQDGTWASFIEFRDRPAARLPASIERPGEQFSLAGFAPSGRWLATVSQRRVQLLSWPDLSELAQLATPSERELFDWHATYVGESFVSATLSPDEESYRLIAWSSDLRVEAIFAWERGDQRYLLDMAGLPDQQLLLFGDRRAGLFRLRSR